MTPNSCEILDLLMQLLTSCGRDYTLQVRVALVSVVGLPDLSIMSTVYVTTLPFSMTWSCSGEMSMDTGAPARQRKCNCNRHPWVRLTHGSGQKVYQFVYFLKIKTFILMFNAHTFHALQHFAFLIQI